MTVTRPRAERGAFPPGTEHYGRSLLGAPLIWFPAPAANSESGLILAGTHGDENSSVVTLSCALRTLTPSLRRHHVVLNVNPDGSQLGLRANANGVDLNRNFRQLTGKRVKLYIAGIVLRQNETWYCSQGMRQVQNLKLRHFANLFIVFSLRGLFLFTTRWPALKIHDKAN